MSEIPRRHAANMRLTLALAVSATSIAAGCAGEARAFGPEQIERQYGVSGSYSGSVSTPNGPIAGTIIPVQLADGSLARIVIPQARVKDVRSIYLLDSDGMHPMQLAANANRQNVVAAPSIVRPRPVPLQARRLSWEKDVLVIGASAGTTIGALAGGSKEAAGGASSGGVSGLVYDLLARDRK